MCHISAREGEKFFWHPSSDPMAHFAVDCEGKRIETDILVAGYINEHMNQYELQIPDDIIGICFLFWFIKVCDEWDREHLPGAVKIDGQTVKATSWGDQCVYGCHSIDKGSHQWTLQLTRKTTGKWFCIGIIEDKPEILKEFQNSVNFILEHGCLLHSDGKFYRGSITYGESYMGQTRFEEEDTRIAMALDMDNHTLSFNIDGIDYGVATNKLDKDRYRMVITLDTENHEVKLL